VQEATGEMKRVAWPIRSSVLNNSLIVVGGVVVVGAAIAGIDIGLTKLATALF
jgi:preprotein translocase SecE subunit